jgi:hypothetical protein
VKVYCASKARHLDFWRALRAAGVNIQSGWIDAEFNITGEEPNPHEYAMHWDLCCRETAAADIVLLYAREDERQMGALIEAGAALGAGKQVYLVAPWAGWSFRHRPRVRCFDTLEAAVTAIKARQAGEEARERALSEHERLWLR